MGTSGDMIAWVANSGAQEHIGRKNSADLADKSPTRAAAKVKAPVLLIHSVDPPVVPVSQSREMMKALGGRAPHELVELPGEDATRARVLIEMARFLAKHLPVTGASGN